MLIFLILSTILCTNENITKEHRFFIVTDREIKGLVMKDKTQNNIFLLEYFTCSLRDNLIWDKYFPKPIIYEFNCENLMKSKSPDYLNLEGITSTDEVLFRFILGFNHNFIALSDFFDSYNVTITNAQFDIIEDSKNIFMMSREAKNVESLKESFRYIIYTDAIEPLCMEILMNLFRYIKNIEYFATSVNIENDESILRQLSVAENAIISITITILLNLSSLRIPIIYNLDKLPTLKTFKTIMHNVFQFLEGVIEVHSNEKNKKSKNEIAINKQNINKYIRNEIIQFDSLTKCVQIYGKYITEFKSIKEFVTGVFHRNNINVEILSDCNIEKIDEFVRNYSFILISYCKIMKNAVDKNVFRHYFPTETSEIEYSIKKLDDFFTDKLVANRLMHFINSYEQNKTDLLIFFQTDYFKYKLSFQIIENLNLLAKVCLIYYTSEETQDNSKKDALQINLEYYSLIKNLKKTWLSILQDEKTFDLKCFKLIISQDKLPLPIIYDETLYKPVVLEEEKEENKLSKRVEIKNSVNIKSKDKISRKSIFVISAFIIMLILIVYMLWAIKINR